MEMAAWRYIDRKQVPQQGAPSLYECRDASTHSSQEKDFPNPHPPCIYTK